MDGLYFDEPNDHLGWVFLVAAAAAALTKI